ncbi:acyltransferase [Virgibacillus necropolis]|uniref:acyltransferase n=1 Tax=Virgibacillus necropolis TaxID=163877 RepID=UPI0013747FD1|nr:acyltransferase [Virgibacillus necropolis]
MERNYSIDFVKFFAIFFVVIIHTNTVSGIEVENMSGSRIDFLIDSFARFAVPFFFITSGYLFMQKMISIHNNNDGSAFKKQLAYFKKYIIKLVNLYISWFVFYFLFELWINFIETEKNMEALSSMFKEFIAGFSLIDIIYYGSNAPQQHLWFLLALIWSIIIVFIFVKLRLLKILFVISIFLHIYGLLGQSYSMFYEVSYNTRDALFFGLFYIALGAIFAKFNEPIKVFANRILNIEYILFLVVLSFLQVMESFVTMKMLNGNGQNYFIATIPLIIVLFLAFIKHPNVGKGSFISKIGANAVGIYVSHIFIMEIIRHSMYRFGLSEFQGTVLWRIIFTPAVFIIAYFFYAGLQKGKPRLKTFFRQHVYQSK